METFTLCITFLFSQQESDWLYILCPLCLQLLRRLWASEPGHVVPILLQAQQEAQGEFLLLPHPVQECPECKRTDAGWHNLTAGSLCGSEWTCCEIVSSYFHSSFWLQTSVFSLHVATVITFFLSFVMTSSWLDDLDPQPMFILKTPI